MDFHCIIFFLRRWLPKIAIWLTDGAEAVKMDAG